MWAAKELVATATESSVKGSVAVVTGAGSGIGRLLCLALAGEGARISLWDINSEAVEAVAEEIRAMGGEARCYVGDVSDREAVYALADRVKADFGRVDILINNAGIVVGKTFLEVPDRLAEKTMAVNTIAHFWTTKAFLPDMIKRNSGHLVTIASAAGTSGVVGLADYCASKWGAVGFDESLRMELRKLGKTGVQTLCVCPYYINTGMFDGVKSRFPLLLPILEPDYVCSMIVRSIRRRDAVLCLPRIVYLNPLLRGLLPTAVLDYVAETLGVSDSMSEFKGRARL